MMHLKDVFALFDASFNGLSAIVGMKLTIQIGADISLTIMEQHSPLYSITSVVMEQGDL